MLFVNAVLAGSFAVLAAAQSSVLGFTRVPNPITAGQPQAITYMTNDTTSPVTIILRQGNSGNLQTIQTLTTQAFGGQYIWTPATTLPNDSDYALEITQGSQLNYFGPFSIQGGGEASSSSASSSSSSSSATTSAVTLSTGLAGINATMTSFGSTGIPLSTGVSSHHNSTVTSAPNSTTVAVTSATPTPTSTDAGFQGTSTPTPTGNGAAAMGSSAIALVFGAMAAIAFC